MDSIRLIHKTADEPPSALEQLPQFWFPPRWAFALGLGLSLVLFVVDVILPRGATVSIGYCAVPAIAAGTRSRRVLVGMASLCTVLNWLARSWEPVIYSAWEPLFNRALVTAVIWFALVLVLKRLAIVEDMARRQRVLTATTLELERSNGELSNFTSIVAHDLRGPLNTIGLFAQLLAGSTRVRGDDDCVESVEAIQSEVVRMNDFVQSLLAYARVGSASIRKRDCDCGAIFDEVKKRLKADMAQSGAEVSSGPLPMIRADPTLIGELLQNLIENGLRYHSEAAPKIHVSAVPEPGGVLFCVQDNGRGIPVDHFDRIFEPFQQGHGGQSPGVGLGLGLATCKRIVERHGGHIYVQSRPGEGASFFFTIESDELNWAVGGSSAGRIAG